MFCPDVYVLMLLRRGHHKVARRVETRAGCPMNAVEAVFPYPRTKTANVVAYDLGSFRWERGRRRHMQEAVCFPQVAFARGTYLLPLGAGVVSGTWSLLWWVVRTCTQPLNPTKQFGKGGPTPNRSWAHFPNPIQTAPPTFLLPISREDLPSFPSLYSWQSLVHKASSTGGESFTMAQRTTLKEFESVYPKLEEAIIEHAKTFRLPEPQLDWYRRVCCVQPVSCPRSHFRGRDSHILVME